MKLSHTESRPTDVEVVDDILCNLCGLTCILPGGCGGPHGLIEQSVSGGYESTPGNGCGALDDGDSYRFSLCEFCLDWLFAKFKIVVHVSDYMRGGGETTVWRPAEQRVSEDEWRSQKERFRAERMRRSLARAPCPLVGCERPWPHEHDGGPAAKEPR